MHNKNNNKSQSYIQGLRPFSNSIPKTLKKYLRKGGYNYSNIVDNWTKIVNKKIADSCFPIAVKMKKEMKDGDLILNVIHGKEIEIEYAKNEIMEKINSFFGYNCISKITLKIVKHKIDEPIKVLPKIKDKNSIDSKIRNLKNEQLKKSLKNFFKAYKDKND